MNTTTASILLFHQHSIHHLIFSLLVFLLLSFSTHLTFIAQGRSIAKPVTLIPKDMKEEKMMIMRGKIGSRPPNCEKRCSSCGHCEAIQVPTNPQINGNYGAKNKKKYSSVAYLRGDYHDNYSNYKPLSWKCKCGKFIFNP